MNPLSLTITPDPRLALSPRYKFKRSSEVRSIDSTLTLVALIATTAGAASAIASEKDRGVGLADSLILIGWG